MRNVVPAKLLLYILALWDEWLNSRPLFMYEAIKYNDCDGYVFRLQKFIFIHNLTYNSLPKCISAMFPYDYNRHMAMTFFVLLSRHGRIGVHVHTYKTRQAIQKYYQILAFYCHILVRPAMHLGNGWVVTNIIYNSFWGSNVNKRFRYRRSAVTRSCIYVCVYCFLCMCMDIQCMCMHIIAYAFQ